MLGTLKGKKKRLYRKNEYYGVYRLRPKTVGDTQKKLEPFMVIELCCLKKSRTLYGYKTMLFRTRSSKTLKTTNINNF